MTITKNLGGDRLGSGNKMNIAMHNYERSSHNLDKIWRSSMSAGTLVPFMTHITLPGDTFDIDLNTMIRTVPTLAPLFGSFKVQLDVFSIPIRLYNAQLHMNKLGVGLKMSNIQLPRMKVAAKGNATGPDTFDQSTLMAYLGVRGAPKIIDSTGVEQFDASFKKNALFVLAYWDIYKNYYSNKQEEIGYLISNNEYVQYNITSVIFNDNSTPHDTNLDTNTGNFNNPFNGTVNRMSVFVDAPITTDLYLTGEMELSKFNINIFEYFNATVFSDRINFEPKGTLPPANWLGISPVKISSGTNGEIRLKSFKLSNIDDTQLDILSQATTTPYEINENSLSPYIDIVGTVFPNVYQPNYMSQNGLGIKTYQSDIFNNWLNTEWIDGTNGINTITAISTVGDSFTLDTLNLSKKVYDMLNRVAVSGGSYEDWQSAIWGEEAFRRAESPIYLGGLSTELVFEEVISTADSTTTTGSEQPLGTLAGRGTQSNKRKGGKIVVKTTEPSMIMGIISITPRIDYSTGNKWFTNLENMDDFHKPALDGIGFQELITEKMAHWDAIFVKGEDRWITKSAGKQPAWIDYMTDYNETYGHFAMSTGDGALMQMTLNRQYEFDVTSNSIKDLTTYVDPVKYNYAFATKDLSAQNFWVQIAMDVTARRKMSAKIIPNL